MRLFARLSFDEVTVGDIADAAEMTPAAVYYHFAGKEQILLEGTRMFTVELIECARQGFDEGLAVDELMASLLQLIGKRRTFATVYFVGSSGLNPSLEAHRKTVRADLTDVFMDAARRARGKLSTAEAGVMGTALVSLLEMSAVSLLARDASYRSLGARRLRVVAGELVNRIIGVTGTTGQFGHHHSPIKH